MRGKLSTYVERKKKGRKNAQNYTKKSSGAYKSFKFERILDVQEA